MDRIFCQSPTMPLVTSTLKSKSSVTTLTPAKASDGKAEIYDHDDHNHNRLINRRQAANAAAKMQRRPTTVVYDGYDYERHDHSSAIEHNREQPEHGVSRRQTIAVSADREENTSKKKRKKRPSSVSNDEPMITNMLRLLRTVPLHHSMAKLGLAFSMIQTLANENRQTTNWIPIIQELSRMALTVNNPPCSFMGYVSVLYILEKTTLDGDIVLAVLEKYCYHEDGPSPRIFRFHLFRARWLKLILERKGNISEKLYNDIESVAIWRLKFGPRVISRIYQETFKGLGSTNEQIINRFIAYFAD